MIRMTTFCLNPETSRDDTYQNWTTVRLHVRSGLLERKSNKGGNGQTWDAIGIVHETEVKLFDTDVNRLVATVLRRNGHKCNVAGYGAAYSKACAMTPRVNVKTGRKLTAAPSIVLGRPPRDRNRNVAREKASAVSVEDMRRAIEARNAK